ncbi:MAG: hypothetical protein CMC13_09890 [Flavobacteriaceae bacterium]|mgnify:CR=1 FL=1|nr:hypothetical protein [Flavobacteriaceae bacterium]|tara:strand:+ start:40014 stop:41024 length:1011 start_codon:yes stop_codon:yes gene_type:complete
MISSPIDKAVQAIKDFDIEALSELLDDDKSYMDVSKSLFLKKLAKNFKTAKEGGCHSFDDVYFGICESCNKGCEGMTFFSESGHYLDLFIESKDDITVDDMYVCNKLTNFIDLEKTNCLNFTFCLDEKVTFRPSSDYILVEKQFQSMANDIKEMQDPIKLNDFANWYDGYSYIKNFLGELGVFECFDYKLYDKANNLFFDINSIINIKSKTDQATEALISFQVANSERERLIWFFKHQKDQYGSINFTNSETWDANPCITYTTDNIKLTVDLTGYEYVIDYFSKLDNLYNELMEKYKPLPEHFEQSATGSIEYSLENHLRLHNKHLDVLEKYGKAK